MFWQLFLIYTVVKSVFSVNQLCLSIEENRKPNSLIGNLIKLIQNQTKDQTKYKSFTLESEKSNIFGRNLISIDSKNGDISVQSTIDREEICQTINKCTKGAYLDYVIFTETSQLFALKIEIIDINDNFPSFQPDEKIINIPESIARSTEFPLPVAKDKDSEKFGVQKYYLKPISSSLYEKYLELIVNQVTRNPYLRVIAELDRENINRFEFHLYASDGSRNQGKCRIIVEITDVNDNTPQWLGLPYRKEINECTTENKVLQLNAHDKDDPQTLGGQIRFKISDNTPNYEIITRIFYITDTILYLNMGALKSFKENKVFIFVIAADGEGRSNETTVDLDIRDCNDHRPTIQVHSSSLKIKENEKSKISVTRITVIDDDQGINSEFTCSLNDTTYVSLDGIFHAATGNWGYKKIFQLNNILGTHFDRETTSRYSVEITCSDSGIPTMSSSETIVIFISDENDNPPRFESKSKTFSISEDAKIGNEIGTVTATDIDSSPNNFITYSIISDDEIVKQTFDINGQGQIQLSKTIDREEKDRYKFFVQAKDSGQPSLNDSCEIRILVLDVNDNTPEISSTHSFKIFESWGQEHKTFNAGKLNASDRDSGANGTFKFHVKSKMPLINIVIHTDGKIVLFGVIDREKVEKIDFLVEVIDNGSPARTATTTIHIEVLDLNDNRPKFINPVKNSNNYLNLTCGMTEGRNVGEIKATDDDFGVNGSITYNVTSLDFAKDLFTIQSDGQIILNKKLEKNIKYPDRLIIEARDQGKPSLTATTTLYIRYSQPKESFDNRNNENLNEKLAEKDYSRSINKSNGYSNNAIILGFLVVAIMMIVIVVGGIAIYIYCRGQGISRLGDNNKHSNIQRDSNNVIYQKGCPKNMLKAENQINDTYNPIGIGTFQPNYTNLMMVKNCFPSIDNSYQFSQSLLTDNYSAFHPKSNTPTPDKDNQEFSAFNADESWKQQMSNTTMHIRKKTISDSSDNIYETEHKYAFIHGPSINNLDMNHELNDITHFTTPSQNRRSDFIQSRSDSNQKVKINLVNSSFV